MLWPEKSQMLIKCLVDGLWQTSWIMLGDLLFSSKSLVSFWIKMISQLSTLPTIIKPSFREQQQAVASLIGKTFFLGYVEHVWVRGVVRGFMSSDRCTGHQEVNGMICLLTLKHLCLEYEILTHCQVKYDGSTHLILQNSLHSNSFFFCFLT